MTNRLVSDAPPPTGTSTTTTTMSATSDPHPDPDSDSDLSGLEDDASDATLANLQASRLAELRSAAAARTTTTSTASPYSHLRPFTSEKSAMHTIAAAPLAILLFTHPDFPLCKTMSTHLDRIAGLYAQTQASGSNEDTENVVWIELEAEKATFLTERLRIRVLPAVVGYAKGEEVGRLVGFEGLGRKAQRDGGWRGVLGVLREWGVVGRGRMVGEEDGGDEESEEEEGEGEVGEKGGWIGGRKSNLRASGRGTGRAGEAEEDEDDWD